MTTTLATAKVVKTGRLDGVLPMIAKKAIDTYNKLPSSERGATSVEDLIEEGKIVAVQKAAKAWKADKNTKFSTFLFECLDNRYTDIKRAAYSDMRRANVYSADSTYQCTSGNKPVLLYDLIRRSRFDKMEDSMISRIDAEKSFIRAYANAYPRQAIGSPRRADDSRARMNLIIWILQPNGVSISDENAPSKEFRDFSIYIRRYVTPTQAKTIHRDLYCRISIATSILRKYVTPRGGRVVRCMEDRVERRLLPFFSANVQNTLIEQFDASCKVKS